MLYPAPPTAQALQTALRIYASTEYGVSAIPHDVEHLLQQAEAATEVVVIVKIAAQIGPTPGKEDVFNMDPDKTASVFVWPATPVSQSVLPSFDIDLTTMGALEYRAFVEHVKAQAYTAIPDKDPASRQVRLLPPGRGWGRVTTDRRSRLEAAALASQTSRASRSKATRHRAAGASGAALGLDSHFSTTQSPAPVPPAPAPPACPGGASGGLAAGGWLAGRGGHGGTPTGGTHPSLSSQPKISLPPLGLSRPRRPRASAGFAR